MLLWRSKSYNASLTVSLLQKTVIISIYMFIINAASNQISVSVFLANFIVKRILIIIDYNSIS